MSFELKDIRMIRAGTTSMVAGMCEELRLEAIIDGLVEWDQDQDQVRVAPGTLAKAIVINVLDGRTPLYLLPEYFAKRDTEALLGKGIAPEHVNDGSGACWTVWPRPGRRRSSSRSSGRRCRRSIWI